MTLQSAHKYVAEKTTAEDLPGPRDQHREIVGLTAFPFIKAILFSSVRKP